MKIVNTKNDHWKPCKKCRSTGKTSLGPSKRRRRKFNKELKNYRNNSNISSQPKQPRAVLSMCLDCNGSGLISNSVPTNINLHYPTIAIIGGGIAGTALAIACLHRGIPYRLFERDNSFDARSQGYGLTLQQASRSMAALGIPKLKDSIISTRHLVHTTDGKTIAEWGLRKWRGNNVPENNKRKNIHIARQSLRKQCIDQLRGTEIMWGHRLIDIEKKTDDFDISFQTDDGPKKYHADIIVAADGIRSTVRSIFDTENKFPLVYSGCIVALGICSLEDLEPHHLLDGKTVFQTVDGKNRIYIMPYDDKNIMWQFSTTMSENEAQSVCRLGMEKIKEIIIGIVGDWHHPIEMIINATKTKNITRYPIYDRLLPQPDSIFFRRARGVVYIGDAMHPMTPFKGQGANQAILDALELAQDIYTARPGKNNYHNDIISGFYKKMIKRVSSKVTDSRNASSQLHSDRVLRKKNDSGSRMI